MSIRPTKRELHSQETRRRIIEAAEDLFGSYGFEPVSVKDISERAGVTTGALYHHFKNKDDLMMAVFLSHAGCFDELTERFRESADPLGDLEYFLSDVMVKRVESDGLDFTRHRVLRFFHYTPRTEFDTCLEAIIDRGLELGCFRDGASREELFDLFSSIYRGAVYEMCVTSLEFDLPDAVKRRLRLSLAGVAKGGSSKQGS